MSGQKYGNSIESKFSLKSSEHILCSQSNLPRLTSWQIKNKVELTSAHLQVDPGHSLEQSSSLWQCYQSLSLRSFSIFYPNSCLSGKSLCSCKHQTSKCKSSLLLWCAFQLPGCHGWNSRPSKSFFAEHAVSIQSCFP